MFSKGIFNFSNKKNTHKNRVYLDYASRTPVDGNVLEEMTRAYRTLSGNPNALYEEGVVARDAIDRSRGTIASILNAHKNEIIFTSGGTESDNLAILGALKKFKENNPGSRAHVLVSAIEHSAIFNLLEDYEKEYVDIEIISVDKNGMIDLQVFSKMLRAETVIVSVMLANNEIGVIEPVSEIAKIIRKFKKDFKSESDDVYPLLHTDAVQALNYCELNVAKLGVDLMSIASGKIYGPYGIGALYVRRGTPIENMLVGGDQEYGLRPGTENTPGIVGFASAVTKADSIRQYEVERISKLQKYLFDELPRCWSEIVINGSITERLPNNIHFSVPNFSSELLVIELDALGISVSSKSACKSTDAEVSHVLRALGPRENTTGDIRVTLGRYTTKKDLSRFLDGLKKIRIKYNLDKK